MKKPKKPQPQPNQTMQIAESVAAIASAVATLAVVGKEIWESYQNRKRARPRKIKVVKGAAGDSQKN